MSKILLVSNRLSTSAKKGDSGIEFAPSMGGLATGLSSLHQQENSLWIGWSGVPSDAVTDEERDYVDKTLRDQYKSIPVDLSQQELDQFYYGFCNETIWPLFHYFPTYTVYDQNNWQAYKQANEKFFHRVMEVAGEEDYIWVHDYQLMLLPGMIRRELPHARIGYFLHIPFPSYEVFRLLPWREELLDGLLGADLVGFHTYDYARHFLSSVRRIMSAEHNMANVKYDNRMIKVDAFPMGIDYDKYAGSSETEEIQQEMQEVRRQAGERRLVLSVDRLDYSKGIPLRLRAFHEFLRNYPEFHGKVSLIMIVAPSRTRVPHYMELKREIDERVSSTNGEFGSIGWTPISYFYRPVPFEQLTAIYAESDVLLVTPLRDGMNLISKEYIAARKDMKGVVVLSETAGSARELGEALAVNPNNVSQIADRIYEALQMPEERQVEKNERMHARLKRYDVHYWADDFMDKLRTMSELQESFRVKRLSKTTRRKLFDDFKQSSKRLFFIDYDGTLITYGESPGVPDEATMESLRTLAQDPRNEVVIISGRQKEFLEERFSGVPIGIIAGHGIWLRDRDGQWGKTAPVTATWKDAIRPVLELYRDRTPGSRVEEHQYSLEWHYGRAEPELATLRRSELMDALLSLTSNHDLSVLEGNKLLEIKNSNVSKGAAAHEWVTRQDWDFVLAIGDDWTDNEVFSTIPDHGYSIKVGIDISSADYFLDSVEMVRLLIGELSRYVDT